MKYTIDYGVGYFHPKLGDTFVYYSAFCHLKNVVWRQKHKTPMPPVWKEVNTMYQGRFNLKIQHGKPTRSNANFMYEMYKLGMKMAEPNYRPVEDIGVLPNEYATIQLNSGHPDGGRDLELDQVLAHLDGIPYVDVGNLKRDSRSVARLLTIQQGARFHIGPDSGCAWTALSLGVETRVIPADPSKLTQKEQMMHQCALSLMSNNECFRLLD